MNTSGFSVKVDTCFDDTLLKLVRSLRKECFEIISEGKVPDNAQSSSTNKDTRLLYECNSNISAELLKNTKALYIPRVNLLVHELDQDNTEVTGIDPQIAMTPIQLERMGGAAVKLSEMLRNVMRNL